MLFSMGWVPRIGRQEAGVAERATGSAVRAGAADGAAGLQFRPRLSARVAPVPLLRSGDDGNPHAAALDASLAAAQGLTDRGGSASVPTRVVEPLRGHRRLRPDGATTAPLVARSFPC
jgi:hypothetical protein